jgi:hypothetical protein
MINTYLVEAALFSISKIAGLPLFILVIVTVTFVPKTSLMELRLEVAA